MHREECIECGVVEALKDAEAAPAGATVDAMRLDASC